MRALFFSAEGTRQEGEKVRGRVERGRLAAPPSDGGNRKLARSGLRQCDCPRRYARQTPPFDNAPGPAPLPGAGSSRQEKTGTAAANGVLYKTG